MQVLFAPPLSLFFLLSALCFLLLLEEFGCCFSVLGKHLVDCLHLSFRIMEIRFFLIYFLEHFVKHAFLVVIRLIDFLNGFASGAESFSELFELLNYL